jgi:hypothetical protein
MEKLIDGHPGRHECWEELAEHSLTHDDLPRQLVDLGGVECWADPLSRNERAVLARKLANASRRFYHAPCGGRRREGDPMTARMARRMASAEMQDLHLDVTEMAEVATR